MLIVEKLDDNYFTVSHKYSESYNSRFKEVPGQIFDREINKRVIPISSFYFFEFNFIGEIVYKTPRWELLNLPMPDYSNQYKLKNKNLKLPKLKINPYYYQEYGAKYMIEKINKYGFVINADAVGLGKTLQSILTMYHYIETKKVKNVLLLCKKALKFQWRSEIEKFTNYDMSKVVILDGTTNKKVKLAKEFNELEDGKILISNYEVTQAKCFDELKKIKFDMLIIDEAHLISNKGIKNSEIMKMSKKIPIKVFLTGTPIMSKADNLYDIVRIATTKYFGKWKNFKEYFIRTETGRYGDKTVGYMNIDELEELAQNITIRRTEQEVAIDLPELIPPIKISCDLDNTQIKILDAVDSERSQLNAALAKLKDKEEKTEKDLENINKMEKASLGLLASYQALANDPRLFLISKSESIRKKFSPFIPKTYKGSPKTLALLDTVENIIDAGEKVIIFSKFERCTQMLKKDIEETFKDREDCKVVLYTGEVNSENREKNVRLFNESNTHNIFIATSAANEGLNLQVSNHVIHYDVADTDAIRTQRNGRARRVGSKFSKVYVYDLISIDTVDDTKYEELKRQNALSFGVTGVNKARSEAIKEAMKG